MNLLSWKMLLRSIRSTLGRFLAILAIVALGVGFFAGIKSSQPDLLYSADRYFHEQKMYDYQMMSSLGLTDADIEAFRAIENTEAEGAYFADAYAALTTGEEKVYHFQSITHEVAKPILTAGRMPDSPGECLADAEVFTEADIGKALVLTESNDEDTRDKFTGNRFVIVGLARSPRYISKDRGSSELGAGKPAAFLLLPESAFADDIFHEILLYCDLPGEIYSETYNNALRHQKPAVEKLLQERGNLRYRDLRREADEELYDVRKELDDGWAEYEDGKREAEEKFEEAEQELKDGQQELDNARSQLRENENTLTEQEESLPQKLAEVQSSLAELDQQDAALEGERAAQAALEIRGTELEQRAEALQTEITSALLPYETATATEAAALEILQTKLSLLEESGEATEEELLALQEEISTQQTKSEEAQTALTQAQTDVAMQYGGQMAALKEEQATLEADVEAFMPRAIALATAEATIAATRQALLEAERQLEAAIASLPEARLQIEEARLQLAGAEVELAVGRAVLDDEKKEVQKELDEALQELEDGEQELLDATADAEEALQLDLYTLDRSSNPGCVTFENDTEIIDALAIAFPVFFVLVAALVCSTTMTRMVHEERTQIGTMKAMGYSSGAIMAKYLLYAGISALVGCVGGFFLGCTGLPYVVWSAYSMMYRYSSLLYKFDPLLFAGCFLVSVPGSLLVTWLACRKVLLEKPAELIRPKAPAIGKRVILERIKPIWSHLSFLSKVSIRNAFRYPSRVLMMILGIGGCTALMVAGFGIKDSLAGVADKHFGEIALYDLSVTLDPEEADEALYTVWEDAAENSVLAHREEVRLQAGDQEKETDLILTDGKKTAGLLSLHESDGTEIPWPEEGEIVVTTRVADVLSLKRGDRATLFMENGEEKNVVIKAICEYYIGHAIFASPTGYSDTAINLAMIKTREEVDVGRFAARLRGEEGVSYVSLTQQEKETMENSMASLDLLVLMLVLCSGALAFITLYNLTNINIMERAREVATVKVLGFTPGETAEYILNENLMLAFLGASFGLLLGRLLHRFVIGMIQVDYLSCDLRIEIRSFVMSFVITLVFAGLTNLFMRTKLEKINMAESLKSVE